jgi:VCBS repeat-containing protein
MRPWFATHWLRRRFGEYVASRARFAVAVAPSDGGPDGGKMSRLAASAALGVAALVLALGASPLGGEAATSAPARPALQLAEPEGALELPPDYVHKLVYRPPLAGVGRIVRSEDGHLFVQHAGSAGGMAVSLLDVAAATTTVVFELPPWTAPTSLIIGGPGDSFFVATPGEVRQVMSDGSSLPWGRAGAMPWYYTPEGRMLGVGDNGTSIVELFPDGTSSPLVTGLQTFYDVVAAADGTIYVSDLGGRLIERHPDGTQRPLAAIVPDNTDLGIDAVGNLYLNNAAAGFVRVDRTTGDFTPITAPDAPCQAIQSPADFALDDSGRVVFASWVTATLTFIDPATGAGGKVLAIPWASTPATDIGPDGQLYVGVTECGAAMPSRVMRFDVDGSSDVHLDHIAGTIHDIDLDGAGGLYVAVTSQAASGIHYLPMPGGSVTVVPDSAMYEVTTLTADPVTGHLFAFAGQYSDDPPGLTLLEFSAAGLVATHAIALDESVHGLQLASAPDGTLYAFATEKERFFTGPEVRRRILRIDPDTSTAATVATITLSGCCPYGSFSVDAEGSIWWTLSPDSRLYQVSPLGDASLFARNLPIDSGWAGRNSTGTIFLSTPEGLHRIWLPTLQERLGLVRDDLDELQYYGALSVDQAASLDRWLARATTSLDRGQTHSAANHLKTFVRSVNELERDGILTKEQAAELERAADDVIERL